MSPRKTLLLGGGLLLLALAPFVIWLATKSGDEPAEARTGLILERFINPENLEPEIVVYLPERELNTRESVPDGKVRLTCFDAKRKTVLAAREDWPLTTDFGGALPHAHRPVAQNVLDAIRSCSLAGGELRMTGSKFR